MDRAAAMPDDHAARVQGVMGQAIVNGTRRGIRSGMLPVDRSPSDYNRMMIGAAERLGERMDGDFAATWQPLLGRWIVEAGRDYAARVANVQEQLGAGIVHVAQARTGLEQAWAANQYQLGTLLAAVDRTAMPTIGQADQMLAAGRAPSEGAFTAERSMTWPGISLGTLFVAVFGMGAVFFTGLLLSALHREAKAQAALRRERERWVYRLAA